MISLVKRTDPVALLSYFGNNFKSPMWVKVSAPLKVQLNPTHSFLRPASQSPEVWSSLSFQSFRRTIGSLEKLTKGGILCLELDFSPPKSISIAALAGPQITEEIIRFHLEAVNDALGFLAPVMLERRMKSRVLRLIPAEVGLLRFNHPWNRANEPQLHSHVLIHRALTKENRALYTYPFFLLQRTIRAVYHYGLAARISQAGYSLRLGKRDSLAWELEGISEKVLKDFSERSQTIAAKARDHGGYFSQAVETRLAVSATRRELPKTEAGKSLLDARKGWSQKVEPEHCSPIKIPITSKGEELLPVPLSEIFRAGSVIPKWQCIGAHLARWLGNPTPTSQAIDAAERLLGMQMHEGAVHQHERGVCYPPIFEQEAEILKMIEDGYARRAPLSWKHIEKTRKWLRDRCQKLAQSSDRTRIVSLHGETLPVSAQLFEQEGKDVTESIITMEKWDARAVLEKLRQRGASPSVVLVSEIPHKGDFILYLERLIPRRVTTSEKSGNLVWKKTPVRVWDKTLDECLDGKRGALNIISELLKKFSKKQKVKPVSKSVVVYARSLHQDQCTALSWERLEKLTAKATRAKRVKFLKPVEWNVLFKDREWQGLGLFVSSNLQASDINEFLSSRGKLIEEQTLRHGQFWRFCGPPDHHGMIEALGIKRKRNFSLDVLNALTNWNEARDRIHLVRIREERVATGTPLLPLFRYNQPGGLFHKDEIVYVKNLNKDGSITFSDGRTWDAPVCLMRPAFFVNGFINKQKSLLEVIHELPRDEDIMEVLQRTPSARLMIILTSIPERDENAIREHIRNLDEDRHSRNVKSFLSLENDDEEIDEVHFLAPRQTWQKIIDSYKPTDLQRLYAACSTPIKPTRVKDKSTKDHEIDNQSVILNETHRASSVTEGVIIPSIKKKKKIKIEPSSPHWIRIFDHHRRLIHLRQMMAIQSKAARSKALKPPNQKRPGIG